MTIIVDASSFILMTKSTIISSLLDRQNIMMPDAVYQEIVRGKEKSRDDAFMIERFVDGGEISIENVSQKAKEEIKKIFGLQYGEGEVIALALEKKLPIMTDDRKCMNAAKALSLPWFTTLDMIIALHQKKKIDSRKAKDALEKLEAFGWYKKEMINKYKQLIT